ncbi:MAG: CHAD domain-containing protein [Burkholderiaceae bacterium]
METELKLLINEQDLVKLEELPLLHSLTVGRITVQDLKNVYFDTPDFDLWKAKAGLRIRRIDGTFIQTLKAGGGVVAGLHQREEWETNVPGEKPDLEALCKVLGSSGHGNHILSPRIWNRLEPVFKSDVTRTVRHLRLSTGDEVEMAIDRGTIEYQDKRDAICEIEFELKSGEAARLYTFALELLEFVPMRIGTRSKAERGYAMRLPQQKRVVKASKLHLTASMAIEEAFEAIVSNCMEQVQGNEHGVMYGTDPENVHQMRVGLRRLRSALGLFEDVIECPPDIQADLKWLAAQLGAARDWEVLAGSTLDHLHGILPKDVNITLLKDNALERARTNREQAANAVNSPRNTRLQLQFAEWVVCKRWREGISAANGSLKERSLKEFANQVLKRGENRLLKRGKHLQGNDPELRHRTRIAGKKARYAMEFFGSLYPTSKVKDYVSRLSDLQEELGWLNDAAVGIDRLEQLQAANDGTVASAAFARGYLFSHVNSDNAKLIKLWKKFTKADVPYKHQGS